MQRDRLRSVLFALQGRETLEIAGTVGRSRAFGQRWACAYRDGGIEAVRGRTAPGRTRRLTPEQEARLVERVKAGAHHETASLRFVVAAWWLEWPLSRWMDDQAGQRWFTPRGPRVDTAFPTLLRTPVLAYRSAA